MEIYETYNEIINLLKCRGADIWFLEAQYLLSYDQFYIYCKNVPEKNKGDLYYRQSILTDIQLFKRLNKQCWVDFILQTYKVFIFDNIAIENISFNTQNQDILSVIIEWFNRQINMHWYKLLKKEETKCIKIIKNITTDLRDGIAFVAVLLNHCPFLAEQFKLFIEIDNKNENECIIHNTCLIIEAMNIIKLNFPLASTDLLVPNFIQILFILIHFYMLLPIMKPKEELEFHTTLSNNFTRELSISSSSHESLLYNHILLYNVNNVFTVEKATSNDNIKKVILNIKYQAYFRRDTNSVLLVQGSNKARIFDVYIVYYLKGYVDFLTPHKKLKIGCPLYRPNKYETLISSPYNEDAVYKLYILDYEPTTQTKFEESLEPKFFVRRLNLVESTIRIPAQIKENSVPDDEQQRLSLNITCMSTRIGNSWIWFSSNIGEFFIKVTTQPYLGQTLETLQTNVISWPLQPCNCDEICECYRTTVVMIPCKNDHLVNCLRFALFQNASEIMLNIFDQLIGELYFINHVSKGNSNF